MCLWAHTPLCGRMKDPRYPGKIGRVVSPFGSTLEVKKKIETKEDKKKTLEEVLNSRVHG